MSESEDNLQILPIRSNYFSLVDCKLQVEHQFVGGCIEVIAKLLDCDDQLSTDKNILLTLKLLVVFVDSREINNNIIFPIDENNQQDILKLNNWNNLKIGGTGMTKIDLKIGKNSSNYYEQISFFILVEPDITHSLTNTNFILPTCTTLIKLFKPTKKKKRKNNNYNFSSFHDINPFYGLNNGDNMNNNNEEETPPTKLYRVSF